MQSLEWHRHALQRRRPQAELSVSQTACLRPGQGNRGKQGSGCLRRCAGALQSSSPRRCGSASLRGLGEEASFCQSLLRGDFENLQGSWVVGARKCTEWRDSQRATLSPRSPTPRQSPPQAPSPPLAAGNPRPIWTVFTHYSSIPWPCCHLRS